jgi:hypothetical protein
MFNGSRIRIVRNHLGTVGFRDGSSDVLSYSRTRSCCNGCLDASMIR